MNIVIRAHSESIEDGVVANRAVVLVCGDVQGLARAVEERVEFVRSNGVLLALLRVRQRARTSPVGGHATDDTSNRAGLQIELGNLVRIVAVDDEGLIDRKGPGLSIESWNEGVTGWDADGLERAFEDNQ